MRVFTSLDTNQSPVIAADIPMKTASALPIVSDRRHKRKKSPVFVTSRKKQFCPPAPLASCPAK